MFGVLCICLAGVIGLSEGYGSGAPDRVCSSMTPGHSSEQSSANPYSIVIGSGISQYEAGVNVPLTISGDDFQGILLQARKVDGSSSTSYGTFTVSSGTNVKVMTCSGGSSNNAVTHSNIETKNDLSVTWTPPSENVGELQFVATVAKNKVTWWKNTSSSSLTFKSSGGSGTTKSAGPNGSSTSSSSTSTRTSTKAPMTTTEKDSASAVSRTGWLLFATVACLFLL